MVNKVRVYGKAQNRTVLGIANAYLVMYPDATLDDLNKAFPGSLNSSGRADTVFVDVKDATKYRTQQEGISHWELFFFEKSEDLLRLQNGQKVAMQQLWIKSDFDKIVDHAKQYGIEVAEFKPKEGFKKGGFTLEYINGYVPSQKKKKKTRWFWKLIKRIFRIGKGFTSFSRIWWLWLMLLLLLLVIIFMLHRSCNREPQIIEKEKVVTVEKIVKDTIFIRDTVFIEQVAEIEKNFNAAKFEQGKAALSDESKFVLHDLAKLMEKNPGINLKIVGHTSAEGDAAFNQKLSEERAKAAVDFLISRGIDSNRLSSEGKGSSEPLDPNNPEINRRTEFIVIE